MSSNREVFISSSSLDHVQVIVLNDLITTCSRATLQLYGIVVGTPHHGHYSGYTATPFSKASTSGNSELKRNNEFVRLEEDFKAELERKKIELGDLSFTVFQNVRQYASVLLDLKPTAISVQATYDRTILFTVVIGDNIGYFEYWIDYNLSSLDDPMDEMVLNVFKGKEHVLNFSGEFIHALSEFVAITDIKSVPIPVTA